MAKKFRVEITSEAEEDIRSTQAFIARDNPRAALKWVQGVKRQARSLSSFPLRFEVIPEAPDLEVDYRHLIFGNYRLIYQILGNQVKVLRVIHAARSLHRIFREHLPSEQEPPDAT